MSRRPDLLDHLAPFSTRNAAGALACLAMALTIAASLWRLAALAPVGP
ncbi:hypothetical protein [Siculibacillus lacustris]|nr:hypothetical protein [Siculibacillus lacustris]